MNLNFDIIIKEKSHIVISNSILDKLSNYIDDNFRNRQIIFISQKKKYLIFMV